MSRENAIKFLRDISMGIDYLENAYSANRQVDDNSLRVTIIIFMSKSAFETCNLQTKSIVSFFLHLHTGLSANACNDHNNYHHNNAETNHFSRKIDDCSIWRNTIATDAT